ncbi:VUT family protein [uncultured Enterovirga sp.]|uniref:VUT family protein n=1 Tax=uncultured Enterovirga sp. TaxID=2026352 RepID=UPI0035CB085A
MLLARQRLIEGCAAFAAFTLTIPVANWMIGQVGTTCVPAGPCLIPVAPGLMAPSGVVMAGLALVLRDLVQRRLGFWAGVVAIAVGGLISMVLAPAAIVVASATAFLLSELADLLVYTPLQRRHFVWAVVLSSTVGLAIDSAIFLQLAFGSQAYLPGQIVGKLWMVLIAIPALAWLRRRDDRIGLQPA